MRVLVGCECSGVVRRAFRALGHDAWSCDLLPAQDGSPHHLQCDLLTVLDRGWDLGIFHPVCTYLTNSAEWAYKDPDFVRYPGVGYHQRLKPGTLFGGERRRARIEAVQFVFRVRDSKIPRKVFENPAGHLSSAWRKPNQTIQPNQFGDDASKATCLWIEGDLPLLTPTLHVPPRMVNGRPRWANRTDSGQNKLSPRENRRAMRSETFPGIAAALADQYTRYIALHP